MLIQTYIKQNRPLQVKKGQFSTAYIYTDKVIIHTNDPIKECLAHNWFPDTPHFPVVNHSTIETNKDGFFVYEMPVYKTGRSVQQLITSKDYINLYVPLRQLADSILVTQNPCNWHFDFIAAVEKSNLTKHWQYLLIQAYEACMNYSHKIRFEISPRNVAADNKGRLILLDCFFIPPKTV